MYVKEPLILTGGKEGLPIKIRIIGGCGSGKSYIARALSRKYGIPHFETDNFVWERGEVQVRRSPEARDAELYRAMSGAAWIIEGVHYKWGLESFRQADLIVVIKPNKYSRDLRVVQRFIKTGLRLEQRNYRQTFQDLYVMLFDWNRGFEQEDLPNIIKMTEEYAGKRIVVNNNREILKYAEEHLRCFVSEQ